MADDPKILAASMINMYGDDAATIARRYVDKHKIAGEREDHAIWLQTVEYITAHRNALNG